MEAQPTSPFVGLVYRAHNPRWAFAPASGDGAAHHGGRFNPRGNPALYTSLDPKAAWMDARQGLPFKALTMTLVGDREALAKPMPGRHLISVTLDAPAARGRHPARGQSPF